jgi:hypothetical protein
VLRLAEMVSLALNAMPCSQCEPSERETEVPAARMEQLIPAVLQRLMLSDPVGIKPLSGSA